MVDAVQHGARAHGKSQGRRRASGPVFSVPSLSCADYGGVVASASAPVAVPVGKFAGSGAPVAAPAGTGAKVAAAGLSQFVGKSAGSGQCVALAKAVQPALGSTSHWRGGERVQGNTSLQPGTVIATFNHANRYANALDGSSHAAVYLGQNARGVQVLDQWAGSPASVRTIPWHNSGAAANRGSAFQVVNTT